MRFDGAEQLHLFEAPDPSWLYFMSEPDGLSVKVGISDSPHKRRRQLQTGNADDLILMGAYPEVGKAVEGVVHDYFAGLRLKREWFMPQTPEFKLTALGEGLPLPIYEAWRQSEAEIAALSEEVQSRNGRVPAVWTAALVRTPEYRRRLELDQEILRRVAAGKPTWFYKQPIVVAVDALWLERLRGELPFELDAAIVKPSTWTPIVNGLALADNDVAEGLGA